MKEQKMQDWKCGTRKQGPENGGPTVGTCVLQKK